MLDILGSGRSVSAQSLAHNVLSDLQFKHTNVWTIECCSNIHKHCLYPFFSNTQMNKHKNKHIIYKDIPGMVEEKSFRLTFQIQRLNTYFKAVYFKTKTKYPLKGCISLFKVLKCRLRKMYN